MSREKLHLTVAAIVCFEHKFLLVEEIDKLTGKRVLNQPAGHVEQDEDLLSAAKRELFEETGLTLEPSAWLGISQLTAANGHRYVRLNVVFEPATLPVQYQPQDSDILALHWYGATELANAGLPLRSRLVSDAITLYNDGVRLPLSLIQPTR
ncbi:NUDIX domain-containing protein [Rheinheimera sp. YQF-2]|uniref:NUDIX domain-containing protein n=1 Tax=Rheinheimera lutimaris TaxID=2740584 RepID=A0A7Y5EGL5_9GAMM|nr:NUDIX domain-containing protein [Rheinheimera lutimaris]NRQ41520.1 NUDIX domain-containing protein [Rheinheimera lutimaris]